MNDRERFLATMHYRSRDRCPWGEMGFWPETLEVWHDQGMPEDVHLNEYLGFLYKFAYFDGGKNRSPLSTTRSILQTTIKF